MPYKDKEKKKENAAKYNLEHKDELKASKANWYANHKEKMRIYQAKRYATNKERLKEYYTKYDLEHKAEKKERSAKRRISHRQNIKEQKAKQYLAHKEEHKEKNAKYRLTHKDDIKEYKAKYYLAHKEEIKECARKYYMDHEEKQKALKGDYVKQRKVIDPLFKMKCDLRTRIYIAFNRMKLNKPCKTEELLGADFKTVMLHIESQFIFNMSWEKVGKEIHIDHKKPLALAKTEKQLIKLCHYTNLQPLWAEENLRKQAKTDYIIKEVRFG